MEMVDRSNMVEERKNSAIGKEGALTESSTKQRPVERGKKRRYQEVSNQGHFQ
jgi:hypothetical protein